MQNVIITLSQCTNAIYSRQSITCKMMLVIKVHILPYYIGACCNAARTFEIRIAIRAANKHTKPAATNGTV
jgi:hypothetical protein